ncbi:MAG: hypothetical protein FWC95_01380 [Defluviitaleaceae bacterium]|nr:hypothetical protein [Defluviitaleaceae bacterium]
MSEVVLNFNNFFPDEYFTKELLNDIITLMAQKPRTAHQKVAIRFISKYNKTGRKVRCFKSLDELVANFMDGGNK